HVTALLYSVGTGALIQIDWLHETAARGIGMRIVVNHFATQPQLIQLRLLAMVSAYRWCELFDFSPDDQEEELHAKVFIADRQRMLIGSANLSRRGLLKNYEMAVVVAGHPAEEAARAIDQLLQDNSRVHRVDAAAFGHSGAVDT